MRAARIEYATVAQPWRNFFLIEPDHPDGYVKPQWAVRYGYVMDFKVKIGMLSKLPFNKRYIFFICIYFKSITINGNFFDLHV